jgi:hypothetical protein
MCDRLHGTLSVPLAASAIALPVRSSLEIEEEVAELRSPRRINVE